MDQKNIYKTSHQKQKNIRSSQQLTEPYLKIDHITGQKARLKRYKKIEITPCILSDYHGLRLDFNNNINNKKQTKTKQNKTNRKPRYAWKINNSILNDKLVSEEIKIEIKDFLEFNENEGTTQ